MSSLNCSRFAGSSPISVAISANDVANCPAWTVANVTNAAPVASAAASNFTSYWAAFAMGSAIASTD